MIILSLGLGYYLVQRFKLEWGIWLAGGFTFILSQIIHIPFNTIFVNPLINNASHFITGELPIIIFTSTMLGLSAGIFEETARYIVYRWWQRDVRSWSKAVVFGAGHGGMEAILLGLLVLYTFSQMIILRNAEQLSNIPEIDRSLVQQQVDAYWSVPWHLSLMGAVERALTIPFHISAAILVLQTLKRHQMRWLVLAIIWHTLVNSILVSAVQLWGVYVGEGLLCIMALISIGIIFVFREPYAKVEVELAPLKEPLSIDNYSKIEVSRENLERTRYN